MSWSIKIPTLKQVTGDLGHSLTHLSDWQADGDVAKFWDHLVHPQAAPVDGPGSKMPTLADTNLAAAGQQLAQEKQMRSSWNILTGGQGVLDSPQTMSPQLLGS